MWKKQDLTTAETCCSMESSASKVTPSVFTTLENGIDASPGGGGGGGGTVYNVYGVWYFLCIRYG